MSTKERVPDRVELVSPSDAALRSVVLGKAKVVVPPGAVVSPTSVGVAALGAADLAKLDSGLTNVTGREPAGFRFSPHPMKFASPVEVTLPYDPALLPAGFKPDQIFTYFFDDVVRCWVALERVSVDEKALTVTSRTDHFTDMINATAMVPEHPENVSFNPNQLKGIQAAGPGAKVNEIAPPGASSGGDAGVGYPFEVPAGRDGLQPSVSVGYSSAGGNGWVGQGWDVGLPTIVVDTRWGVPRYDLVKETESYLLNGGQLTPVSHRGPPVARSTGDRVFHARIEGGFAKIVRKGTDPKSYSWEVTDKSGTVYSYGTDASAVLKTDAGNVFLWALREVRDLHGNFMRFHYATVEDTGVAGGSVVGRNLYPDKITYTGSGSTEGKYSVTFVRDRQLNETLRADKIIDARGGFKRVTGDLLRKVEVKFDADGAGAGAAALVRSYELSYATGAFGKTLLASIKQFDKDGAEFTKHEFSYYDDIRDAQGAYQAFRAATWTVPDDGLSKTSLNLTPEKVGDASAVNATTSKGDGWHLFVGASDLPSKRGSIGVKYGSDDSTSDGVLALVDVDADGLPDKVFRSGGVVKYHKNLAKPGGSLAFESTARVLTGLDGISRESSHSDTFGLEKYTVTGAAAQLDYVNAFSTTDRYFTDVNSDGIADMVSGQDVLFGRVVDDVPVYGLNDATATPVPVVKGALDTSKLFPDWASEQDRLASSMPLLDTVRRWVAPFSGWVKIAGAVKLSDATMSARAVSKSADGVRVVVQDENAEVWSASIPATDNGSHSYDVTRWVTKGQRLYFRVQSNADASLDEVSWDPVIRYLDDAGQLDVNNLPVYVYRASSDFTLAGRASELTMPLSGTVRITGDFGKTKQTSDDVRFLITKDGVAVRDWTATWEEALTEGVDVTVPVTAGQKLKFSVKVESPIDASAVSWTPRVYYTEAGGLPVNDAAGDPAMDFSPPVNMDLYPVNNLNGVQGYYTASWSGVRELLPVLAFNFQEKKPSGRVVFTVKARASREPIIRAYFDVVDGVLTSPGSLWMPMQAGNQYYFDFSTTSPDLWSLLTASSVKIDGYNGQLVPSAFHAAAVESLFAQPYRGWAAFGYNGNGTRAAAPINQAQLVLDDTFDDQLPSDVDPQGTQGDEFKLDPRLTAAPNVVAFYADSKLARWGAGKHSWVDKDFARSARMAAGSFGFPNAADFTDAWGVPRIGRSTTISLTGSVGNVGSVGGSIGSGESTGVLDFLDMNGDGFPDVVGSKGIQYTDPTGALGWTVLATNTPIRYTATETGNASAGSPARTIGSGKGKPAPSGDGSANTAQSGNGLPPFGVGASLGGNDADTGIDLIDVNGDGLPDRVYSAGKVALNLGYAFAAKEPWPGAGALNEGHGLTVGVNLGFNIDFYGFAGGGAYSQTHAWTNESLADMNGDGLVDRVFESGTSLMVAFNTGNGFATPVAYAGGFSDIADDRNATLSGGAYATIPVPPPPIPCPGKCAIFNPGAHASSGAGRAERALRDVNGDGLVDQLYSTADNELEVKENTTGRTNLLKTVSRPLGATITLGYTRDGNTYEMPQSKYVLSSVSVNDGHAGDGADVSLTTFEYSGGVYDRKERQFRGYAQVISQQRDAADNSVYRKVVQQYRTDSFYTAGLVTRTITTDGAGVKYTQTDNTYQVTDVDNPSGTPDLASDTATLFPHLFRTDQRFFEGQATAGKTTASETFYDKHGNVIRTVDYGEPGTGDDVETVVGYKDCPTTHVTGAADSIEVTVGTKVMRKRSTTVDCVTGEVTQVRAYLADGTTSVTDMTYYANGNLHTLTEPANKTGQRMMVTYGYDTTVDTYTESVTDSFGYTSTSTHDFRFGQELTSTDSNGKTVTNTYDSVGRLSTVTGPYEAGTGRVTIEFEYHTRAPVPYAITRHADRRPDGGYKTDTIDTYTFVDGLGRVIQTKADAAVRNTTTGNVEDVMVVSGKVKYDPYGRAVKTYFPTTEAKGPGNHSFNTGQDSVKPTSIATDVLDRVTRTQLPDNSVATVKYGFGTDRNGDTQFETVATDAEGKTSRAYTDVRGRVTAVKQFDTRADGTQQVIWTSFGYNPLGEKTSVTDAAGTTTEMFYDNFGRNTKVVSSDSGQTDFVYDLAGNLVRKKTAKLAANTFIEYDYDYNRVKAIRYPVFTNNNVSYTYGGVGAANNAAGRITEIRQGLPGTRDERSTRYTYGPLGEVSEESRTVKGNGGQVFTFTTRWQFDTWNRVLKMTYPDQEVLTYGYDSGGNVTSATGVKGTDTYTYLSRLDYDKFGQRQYMETGNNTKTNYTYDPLNQHLKNLKSELADAIASGHVFQNVNYTYDSVGNITQIQDVAAAPTDPAVGQKVGGPATETFRYDDLYRLTHAEGSYQPTGTTTHTYTQDTAYDTISNITSKGQTVKIDGTVNGDLTYTNNYTYTTPGKPHAASKIGIYDFAYDAAGNQISRIQPSPGPRRQLIWDEENRLSCNHENTQNTDIPQSPAGCDNAGGTAGSRYLYDAGGERLVKQADVYYFYPNQNYSTRGNSHFKHIYIGATKLLTKTVESKRFEDQQYYSHGDNLGSTGFITDANGQLQEHLKYLPGGETWLDENPAQPVAHQYTGKEYDQQTGLYYYGARYYDPRLAQWQSADPALPSMGTHSVALSTYLYAAGNPITYKDPDGRDPAESEATSAPAHKRRNTELGANQSIMAKFKRKGWACAACHLSTQVHNTVGKHGNNPDNGLPYDVHLNPEGIESWTGRSVIARAIVESAVGAGEFVAGIRRGIPAEPRVTAQGGAREFYVVPGGRHRNATPAEIARFKSSKNETSLTRYSDRPSLQHEGTRTEVGIGAGPTVTETWHSHPGSKTALPSAGDMKAFTTLNAYSDDAVHMITGKASNTPYIFGSVSSEYITFQATTAQIRGAYCEMCRVMVGK